MKQLVNYPVLLLFFFLFMNQKNVQAQEIKIINETNLVFESIIVDYERTNGRHLVEYVGGVFAVKHNDEYEINTTETIPYKENIKLKNGICKLTFTTKDSICVVYAVNTQRTTELVLNRNTALIREPVFPSIQISDGIQLYYNFINISDYIIYEINYKISDGYEFETLFFNTDQRLLLGESRIVFVEQRGRSVNDYMSVFIEFELYAVDKQGNLIKGYLKETDLSVDDIKISNQNFNF